MRNIKRILTILVLMGLTMATYAALAEEHLDEDMERHEEEQWDPDHIEAEIRERDEMIERLTGELHMRDGEMGDHDDMEFLGEERWESEDAEFRGEEPWGGDDFEAEMREHDKRIEEIMQQMQRHEKELIELEMHELTGSDGKTLEEVRHQLSKIADTTLELELNNAGANGQRHVILMQLKEHAASTDVRQQAIEEERVLLRKEMDMVMQEMEIAKKRYESGNAPVDEQIKIEQALLQLQREAAKLNEKANMEGNPLIIKLKEKLIDLEINLAGNEAKREVLEKRKHELRETQSNLAQIHMRHKEIQSIIQNLEMQLEDLFGMHDEPHEPFPMEHMEHMEHDRWQDEPIEHEWPGEHDPDDDAWRGDEDREPEPEHDGWRGDEDREPEPEHDQWREEPREPGPEHDQWRDEDREHEPEHG